MRATVLIAMIFLAIIGVSPATVQVLPNFSNVPVGVIPLAAGGAVTRMMDIYLPPVGQPLLSTVLRIHGGGWQSGTYNSVPASALRLRDDGVVGGRDIAGFVDLFLPRPVTLG
ncbi:MAG: hypothetical protein HS101_09490 [Planctomycetia bacterium]|jgi:hypothetical protein|nr:hypothetical protein [Planctomycetia bacterium]MCC7314801.1 hypothetical protein [Planctomycetota bacterium]OQZ05247.1 MAG: hypothetical protein B6D36_11125 [Planctomycetes bacterium UTPLA1]